MLDCLNPPITVFWPHLCLVIVPDEVIPNQLRLGEAITATQSSLGRSTRVRVNDVSPKPTNQNPSSPVPGLKIPL